MLRLFGGGLPPFGSAWEGRGSAFPDDAADVGGGEVAVLRYLLGGVTCFDGGHPGSEQGFLVLVGGLLAGGVALVGGAYLVEFVHTKKSIDTELRSPVEPVTILSTETRETPRRTR